MNLPELYDVSAVVATISEQNPEGSRETFMQAILDWTDNYSETLAKTPESEAAVRAVTAIGDLWIAYATFEKTLRQWKKCVQVFEDALSDSVAALCDKVYFAYAEFCQSRGKYSNAQKVYIRALSAKFPSSVTDKLWKDFLSAMHAGGATTLTLEMLYAAVVTQTGNFSLPAPPAPVAEPPPVSADTISDITAMEIVEAKEEPQPLPSEEVAAPSVVPAPVVSLPPAAPTTLRATASMTLDWDIDEDEDVDSLLEEYRYRPPVLFCAPYKEPLVSGLKALTASQKTEIETYLQCTLDQAADIDSVYNPAMFVCRVLDVVEGMWMAQALKERHFDAWFSELITSHQQTEHQLQRNFSMMSKQSQKNVTQKQQHQEEINNFRLHSGLQMELLNAIVNKIIFRILLEQQSLLRSISFPHTCDLTRLSPSECTQDPTIQATISKQRQLLCALLSIRVSSWPATQQAEEEEKAAPALLPEALPRISLDAQRMRAVSYDDSTPRKGKRKRKVVRENVSPYSSYGPTTNGSHVYAPVASHAYNTYDSYRNVVKKPFDPDYSRKFRPMGDTDEFKPRVVAESSRDYAMSVLGSRGGSRPTTRAPPPPAFVPPPIAFKPPPEFRPPPAFRPPEFREPPRKKPAYNSYAPPDYHQQQPPQQRYNNRNSQHHMPPYQQQRQQYDPYEAEPVAPFSPPAYRAPPKAAAFPQAPQHVESSRTHADPAPPPPTTAPINQASLPLLQKLASMLKNAKK